MAYSKTNWQNGITPINETNLNKVEQGIYDLGQTVNVQTAGTDLNDYVDNGVYFFDGNRTPSNKPSDVSRDDGYLQVIAAGEGVILHKWIVYRTNDVYQRQKTSGTWNSWTKIGQEKNYVTLSLTNNTEITVTSRYQSTFVNLPSTEQNKGTLFSVENGKVKVNRACTVKVNAQCSMSSAQDAVKILAVQKNNLNVLQGYSFSLNAAYVCIGLTPKIINLNANDYLSLAVSANQNNATLNLASGAYTYLNVEEI